MHRFFTILGLIVVLAPGAVTAQEIFEVPIELELPDAPLVLELDNASLEVVLEVGAIPVLRAFGGSEKDASGAALAVEDNGTIVVRRAESVGAQGGTPSPNGGASTSSPRLRLELVFDAELRLDVIGADLDVKLEAPSVAEFGAEDDEDDEDDEEEDEDDDEEDEGEDAVVESRPLERVVDYNLSLEVTGSSVNLLGVAGVNVNATESYLYASDTRGRLILALAGGTVEIKEHLGPVELTSRDSEVVLSDMQGQITPMVTGGSLIVRGGTGQLEGKLEGALLRVSDRRGPNIIAGSGATVEARDLTGTRLEIKGAQHNLAIEGVQGTIGADLTGGSLTVSELRGQVTVTARAGTDIAVDGIYGKATLELKDSSARLADVVGQVTAGIRGGRLELDTVQRLELVAARAEVVVSRISSLTKAEITNSQLEFDFLEVRHNPALQLRGSTDARVRLRAPCSVKIGEAQMLSSDVSISGCDVHSTNVRRKRYERRGLDGQRRVTLNVKLSKESTLDVEGVP